MAGQITEWDAQGNPIQSPASGAQEWDANGKPIGVHAQAIPAINYSHPMGLNGEAAPSLPKHTPANLPQDRNTRIISQMGTTPSDIYSQTQKFIQSQAPTPLGGVAKAGISSLKNELSPDALLHPLQHIAQGINQRATAPTTSTATGPTEPTAGDVLRFGANIGGNLAGLYQGGERPGQSTIETVASNARNAAICDTGAAALRGLRMPSGSPKIQRTLSNIEVAKPWLDNPQSLEELQSRIEPAKAAVWSPYQETIEQAGDRAVRGPNGMTTIRGLESQRSQLSALNRALKLRDPDAVNLAQQKGLTQADLLNQERATVRALDPHLEAAGIDPKAIRRNFAAVADIGQKTAGKSSLLVPNQPTGIGRAANLSIKNPFAAPKEIIGGVRDLVAGRPMFSANPVDLGIKEGFANAGPRPNLGAYRPPSEPLMLESNVAGNADFGPRSMAPGGFPARPNIVTPPPITPRGLPATTGGGEVQPMIGIRAPQYPALAQPFARERISPTIFNAPEEIRNNPFEAAPSGRIYGNEPIRPRELPAPKPSKSPKKGSK